MNKPYPVNERKGAVEPSMTGAALKKRRLKGSQNSSRKIRKLSDPNGTSKTLNVRETKIEELPWRQVSPGQLDDFEGFFGLEEVEGVVVERNEHTGQLSYQTSLPSSNKRVVGLPSTSYLLQDDEWQGFSDDSENVKTNSPVTKNNGGRHGNPFDALNEQSNPDNQADIRAWHQINDLSQDTLAALSYLGFSEPTPIQLAAIPQILSGNDLIGKAPTGSGKTLAFGIPILEQWIVERRRDVLVSSAPTSPVALIIEPARELAHQIEAHLSKLKIDVADSSPRIATVTGGLSSQKQKRLLAHADIVIATPGRLWDLMSENKTILQTLRAIRIFVVDEADRLLSQGHFNELEQILNALQRKDEIEDEAQRQHESIHTRQTLVFSATFAKELQHHLAKFTRHRVHQGQDPMGYLLQKLNFRDTPKFVDVNPDTQMANNLTEALLEVSDTNKDLYLYALLILFQPLASIRALVFVNSISAVRRIVPFLQLLNFEAFPLHSHMEQKARLKSVERFTHGQSPQIQAKKATSSAHASSTVLVATDVAARGLDIPDVHVVIHYHVPRAADMYIHRSGRTARASAEGASILMAGANEAAGVRRLISQVHAQKAKARSRELRIVTIEDHVLNQLRQRALLAKRIADVEQAKEKSHAGDRVFQQAAEDLGVDTEEIDELTDGQNARGRKRKQRQSEAQQVTKGELKGAKAELRDLLSQRIRTGGVSERYLANGRVNMGVLMREKKEGRENRLFLGDIEGLKLL